MSTTIVLLVVLIIAIIVLGTTAVFVDQNKPKSDDEIDWSNPADLDDLFWLETDSSSSNDHDFDSTRELLEDLTQDRD